MLILKIENFSERQFLPTILDQSTIITATGSGRVPFVSADDIAAVAFHALTDRIPHNTDHLILGPELYSYDEVAKMISEKLGREIKHVVISEEEMAKAMVGFGVKEDYARMLAGLDTAIREGREERLGDAVLKVTGREPKKLGTFVDECVQRGIWVKK
jgi:festuclavine dehydrogenase